MSQFPGMAMTKPPFYQALVAKISIEAFCTELKKMIKAGRKHQSTPSLIDVRERIAGKSTKSRVQEAMKRLHYISV